MTSPKSAATGIVVILSLLASLVFWGSLVMIVGVVKMVLPTRELRRRSVLVMAALGDLWAMTNNRVLDLLDTEWDFEGIDIDNPNGRLLILSNHCSWADIFVLFKALRGRIAFIRFFMKRELLWLPFVGFGCWALGFPFMKRYSPAYLEKHPEKRGEDIETTRRACRRFARVPVAVVNFLEATRFTPAKRDAQQSPYKHLLKPRTGALAHVFLSMQDHLDEVVDVTISYRTDTPYFWLFASNQVPIVSIRVRHIEMPRELIVPAITEPGVERDRFKQWIDALWRQKDETIDNLMRS